MNTVLQDNNSRVLMSKGECFKKEKFLLFMHSFTCLGPPLKVLFKHSRVLDHCPNQVYISESAKSMEM